MPRPLWVCPLCGVKLVSENLSHACGDFSVEKLLAGKGPRARGLFDRFVKLIAACGPYDVAPAETRVAFLAQVRFASVNRLTDEAIDVHFVLPRRVDRPRFRRVEPLGPVCVHHLRLTSARDFDHQLAAWLKAAYREHGERRWLSRPPPQPRKARSTQRSRR